MKVVILAGGKGSRLSEMTDIIPKPMLEIGGKPILWHIMKLYSHYGYNEFIICLGYKGYVIKEYFSHYFLHMSDVTIDLANNNTEILTSDSEPWKVTLVDTGLETMTGGRLKRIEKYIHGEPFMFTYGDGVADVNIHELVEAHGKNKKYATVTAVQTLGHYGAIEFSDKNCVKSFIEKPSGDGNWINGGFFVLQPDIFKYITQGDASVWEAEPIEKIAQDKQLCAYKHQGYWKCMDTLRDKIELDSLWKSGNPPWKVR